MRPKVECFLGNPGTVLFCCVPPHRLWWRGTNFHSCQVSATKIHVASQSPCCAVCLVCVCGLRPDYQTSCLSKTRKSEQPQADGKVIGKSLSLLQQMQRNVGPAQETDTFTKSHVFTLCFLFPSMSDHNGSSDGSASL